MRYLIVGNSAAGISAADAIRRKDRLGEIRIVTDETVPSYYRPLLPHVIEEAPEAGNLYRDALHSPSDVLVTAGIRVQKVLPEEKTVILENRERIDYDKLLLATGASALRPKIENARGSGIFALRTLEDALEIKEAAGKSASAVIIGGGRIGTKTALALRQLGLEVTIVEVLDRLIPQQLDEEASRIFEHRLQELRIKMLFGRKAIRILRNSEHRVTGAALDNGIKLPADFVILCTGVRPNTAIMRNSGIATKRGVLVNDRLETSMADVYAAGDVVETRDIVTDKPIVSGIWTNAVAMGHVAGENMAGGEAVYPGAFSLLNALDIDGIPVISAGVIRPTPDPACEVFVRQKGEVYRKMVFQDNRLVGFIMVGEVERAGLYTALMREHTQVDRFKGAMIADTLTYATCMLRAS